MFFLVSEFSRAVQLVYFPFQPKVSYSKNIRMSHVFLRVFPSLASTYGFIGTEGWLRRARLSTADGHCFTNPADMSWKGRLLQAGPGLWRPGVATWTGISG